MSSLSQRGISPMQKERCEVGAVGDEMEALQDGGSGEEPSVDAKDDGEQEEGADESTEK